MSQLNDCMFAALETQGYTTGTLNDRLYAWLSDQTGVVVGTLNDQWVQLLTDLGYSGTLNDMQVASWVALGAPKATWNDAAMWFWCVNGGTYGPAPPSGPAFHALTPDATTYEMLGVKTGTGDLTTTHTADLYAPDFEGIYREFAANEPVWAGGRVVHNQLANSNDLANTTYWSAPTGGGTLATGIADPDGGTTAHELTSNGAATALAGNANNKAGGGDIRMSLWVRSDDTFTNVQVYYGNGSARGNIESLITNQWQRIALDVSAGASSGGSTGLVIYDTSGSLEIYGFQYESVDGQTNQNPSEYVPTTTAAVTKVFANANGNTVSSNVVTEAVGAPLAEVPYLQYYPAAENECLYSRDLTNAAWNVTGTPIRTYDQTGLTGEPNTATYCEDDATGYESIRQDITCPADSNSNVLAFYVKKETSPTAYPGFQFYYDTTQLLVAVTLNTQAGTAVARTGFAPEAFEVVDAGDFWKVLVQNSNDGTRTSVRPEVYPAVNTDASGNWSSTTTGSCIVGNVELHLNKTIAEVRGLGPIFTTSAAVATDATVYNWDISNLNNQQAQYCEIHRPLNTEFNYTVQRGTSTIMYSPRILTNNEFRTGYGDGASAQFIGLVYDGIDETTGYGLVLSATSGDIGHRVEHNLAWVEKTDFFNAGNDAFYVGGARTATNAYRVRNLRLYDITSYAEGKQIIDDLMA